MRQRVVVALAVAVVVVPRGAKAIGKVGAKAAADELVLARTAAAMAQVQMSFIVVVENRNIEYQQSAFVSLL